MSKKTPLTIGTRASPLAVRQSIMVGDALRAAHQLDAADIVMEKITTKGDRALDEKLSDLGGKGLFTEELEAGLRNGALDLAVHSLKDLPTQNADGLILGAILPRANAADMLIARDGLQVSELADLPTGAHIGTASLRRQAQILRARPDVTISLLRGNIGTRLKKLDELNMDATLLAAAGLERLDMVPQGAVELAGEILLPAAGQGALAVQCRADDAATQALLAPLNCADTQNCVTAERAFLQALDGSCRTPIAALARIDDNILSLHGRLLADDGSDMVETKISCDPREAEQAGRAAGEALRRAAPHLVSG
jgi:hydroxymethylbilane synthase